MNLTDEQKREIIACIEAGKPLPPKYRFLILGGEVQEPLLLYGDFRQDFIGQCENLGATIAAGLTENLF